jgi:hypothetical protein
MLIRADQYKLKLCVYSKLEYAYNISMILSNSAFIISNDFFQNPSLMPSGGKRAGSGRKPGPSWAGKNPRAPDMRAMAKERVREVLTTKNDPLAVLIEIANDPDVDVQIRLQAASSAAPYMFPRLSAVMVAQAPTNAREETAALIERLSHRFARLAPPAPTIDATVREVIEVEAS